jgi:DNA-binding GntR family transcriptional regulator
MQAASSERITRMLSWLVEIPMILKTLEMFNDEDLQRSNFHHRELITALTAKDGPWAQSVMESHLRAAHNIFIKRNNTISD